MSIRKWFFLLKASLSLCKNVEFWCGASSSTKKYQHTISCAALWKLSVCQVENYRCIALRLMTWTNNFSKTFLIFASLIPFFRLIIPEKCFYQWILCHNFVYMKKFPWFLSFELGARQACDRRHRTMGTVHSGKISHLTWTFTKKYWAVLGCTGLYWAVLGHLRYLLGNVQVKWRILPLCTAPVFPGGGGDTVTG